MTRGQILDRLGGEAFLDRMLGQIEAVAFSTDQTGSKGKFVLTVKTFKPKEAEVRDGYVGFETDPVPTLARPKSRKTALYVSEDGLHTNDPRQVEMELRAVEQGDGETRQVHVGNPDVRKAN